MGWLAQEFLTSGYQALWGIWWKLGILEKGPEAHLRAVSSGLQAILSAFRQVLLDRSRDPRSCSTS